MDFRKKTTLSKIPRQLLVEKIPSLFLVTVFSLLFNLSSTVAQTAPFITEWTTISADESITIPTTGSGYDYVIDWGDETSTSGTSSNPSHTYAAPGTYTVQISGSFPRIYFNGRPNGLKIRKILQWGDISWSSMEDAFRGCENMVLVATDAPDLSNVTTTSRMFADCKLHTFAVDAFEGWDVSNVTNMSGMFSGFVAYDLQANLGTWDVSNVRNMSSMFAGCLVFGSTQIDQWDVSSVTNMSNMFADEGYYANLNSWDVSSVTNMSGMFYSANVEGGLSAWNVSSVTNMSNMFADEGCYTNLNSWDVSSVTNMSGMFYSANVEGGLSAWNVSSVTDMSSMFERSSGFSWNGLGVENWDVSRVRNMESMFSSCSYFNADIGDWDVSNVTNMSNMFSFASDFNQDVNGWDVSKVTNMSRMFYFARDFNRDLSSWDVSNVTNMSRMFSRANEFDQSLSTWDVGQVTNMSDLFRLTGLSTANYDATLQAWAELPVLQSNVTLGAEGIRFCLGEAAQCELVSNYNWTILDDGIADNCNNAEISCPVDIITTIDPESCTAVADFTVEAIAGCSSVDFTQTEGLASGSPFPLGTTINTFVVTDYPNNTCSFSVTVLDDVPPVPDMPSLPVITGSCEVVVNGAPTATDDCAGQLVGTTTDPLIYTTQGEYTITWTYEDGKGNTSTQNQTIIVADPIAPTAICKNFTVEIGADGTGSLVAEDINGGSFDNCGIASMTTNAGAAFNCTAVGKGTTITLTVTDFAGNSDNCTASVDFVDAIPPTVVCQDITVQLDASGTGSYLNTDLDGGSTDNCGFGAGSVSFNLVSCNDIGTFQSTLVRTDQSGNTASCKGNVTVVDQVAPTAICQDITVGLDAEGNALITPSAIDNGSSDACGIAELSLNTSTFDCSSIGANSVQLSVVDNSGNTNTCEALVTIEDQVAPNAICRDITVALNEAGLASINALDIDNGSNDNCGLANTSINVSSFSCSDLGANTVELSATDVSGNTSVCTARVKVVDNIAPILRCKDVTVQLNSRGFASFFLGMLVDEISDNCSVQSLPIAVFSVNCADAGSVKRIPITAWDNSGNKSTCSAKVTIVDDRSPQALCQDVSVQLDESGVGSITAASINNGSNDNCGIADLSLDQTSFDCSDLGENTVELTVTDPSGNSGSCSATVRVEDNLAPQAFCQQVTVQLDETGSGSIAAASIDNGSNDNCGLANMSINVSSFDCSMLGANSVVLTVTDLSGNSNSCKTTVNVEDNITPVLECQDVTVSLNEDGVVVFPSRIIVTEESDNCGLTLKPTPIHIYRCSDAESIIPISFSVQDLSGNESSCTATVTIVDESSPQALCQDVTVQLDDTGNGSITAAAINNGSSDNCGIADLSLDRSSFDCDDLGENTVELTVTDPSGNSSSCSATVTVEDNITPQALCQHVTIQLDETGNGSITAAAIDNGSSDACGLANMSLDISSFDCSHLGDNTVHLSVTDLSGNTGSCKAAVKVEDRIAPVLQCKDVTVSIDQNGFASFRSNIVIEDMSDNCGLEPRPYPIYDLMCTAVGTVVPINLTERDFSGNQSSCAATVTIVDDSSPQAVCQDVTVQLDESGLGAIAARDLDNGSNDNCGIADLSLDRSSFDCDNLGENTVELTVTDPSGNSSSCSATVTVEDNVAPIVSSDLFFLGCGEDEGTDLYEVDRMASDNCDVESERSYIAVPEMTEPSMRFRKKNKRKLKFNLADNQITVEAPGNGGAEAWWQEITAEGGVPVDVGQALKLSQPEDTDEWVYKFASSGTLTEIFATSISLISTASDASGNQASSTYTATLQCGTIEAIVQTPSGSSLSMPILDKQELNPMNTTGSMEVFPNPFSIRTTIQYAIANRAEVAIDIYDMNGRQISRLFQGEQDAGQHSLEWDGSRSTGGQLPAGIYLVQLRFGSKVINKRIVLQR